MKSDSLKSESLKMEFFKSSWNDIKTTGLTIFQSARDEDWNKTVELAKQRHELLLKHFHKFPINSENSKHYKKIIEDMIISEDQLQQVINKARARLSTESQKIRSQKQGMNAYHASGM